MKIYTGIILLLFLTMYSFLHISAQKNSDKAYSPIKLIMDSTYYTDTTVYVSVESYPVLITPDREYEINELNEFIKMHLKYPDNGIECSGKVFISFIVEKDGYISNKKFLRKLCPVFDEYSMHIIDLMSKWTPGKIGNDAVRTMITLAIVWKLE